MKNLFFILFFSFQSVLIFGQSTSVFKASDFLEMVYVEGGTFQMGSPDNEIGRETDEKLHEVRLSSFYIGKFEVTVAQFKQFIDETSYKTDADKRSSGYGSYFVKYSDWIVKDGVNWKCDVDGELRPQGEFNQPVIHVSWNDASAFAGWLSGKTNKTYRLPTEAEWEYAARGGNKSAGYRYAGSNSIDEVAWIDDNSGKKTHNVGQKKGNELGIFDMTGNVWEWCRDRFNYDYYSNSPTNNPYSLKGFGSVIRGGGWHNNWLYCRVAFRTSYGLDYRSQNIGFRLVLIP